MRMTKRCRIIAVLCCLAAGMLEASVLAAEMKLTNRQLAEKAQRLQALVEQKLVQAHGMIPMFVRAGDYQLPTAEDYQGAYRHRHLRGKTEAEIGIPPMHVWRAWEDTAANTAYYLRAAAYQYLATGDPQALAICRRTLGALKYIYSLPLAKGEKGFLCKPYGGVYSNQTSGDQMQCVAWGLAAYRPIAPPEDLVQIDTMTKDFADFLIKTGYIPFHGYFGRSAEDLRSEPDKKENWNGAIIHLPMLYLAWQGSGEPKFAKEIQRWYDVAGRDAECVVPTKKFSTSGFGGRRNLYLPAILMEMDPSRNEVWRGAMRSNYRQGRTGLLKDGTWPTFWTYDSKTGKMRPQRQASFGAFDARTGRSALFAMGCVAAQRWLPQEKMLGDARHVLDNLDETTMRFVLPLDDRHPLPPEWQVEAKMLDGDSLTGWLCAYWEGRYRGYW